MKFVVFMLINGIDVYLSGQTSAQKEFGFEHRAAERPLCGKVCLNF